MLDVWREREKQNVLQIAGQENWPIDRVVSALDALMDNRVSDHADIFDLLMDVYEDPFTEKAIEEGAPSGIGKLDEMTNGFQDGELVIVAARPSMGKSDVMLHIAKNAGWEGRLPIIFSLEMADTSLRDRLLASTGRLFSRARMRDPYSLFSDSQKGNWVKTIGRVAETNIQFFDRSRQTVAEDDPSNS